LASTFPVEVIIPILPFEEFFIFPTGHSYCSDTSSLCRQITLI